MICSKCGSETKGIRLNRKLFCTNCGEALLVPEVQKQAPAGQPIANQQAQASTDTNSSAPIPNPRSAEGPIQKPSETMAPPKPKVITAEGNDLSEKTKELETLKAEEEALEIIEKEAKEEADEARKAAKKERETKEAALKSAEIKKHNRDRVTRKKEKDWMVVPNEPNPIEEPELEPPTEDQIEPPKGKPAEAKDYVEDVNLISPKKTPAPEPTKNEFPLLDKEKSQQIAVKRKGHQKVLGEFFKSAVGQKSAKKPKKKKGDHKKLVIAAILLILLLGFIGLMFYVNLYALNPERAKNTAESTISFGYKRPPYVPNGYEISYKTNAEKDFIDYVYEYAPDRTRTLEIKIAKTDLTKENFFSEKIQSLRKSYAQTAAEGVDFYFVEENSLYFTRDGLAYEIISSSKMSQEELTKIAKGLL